MDSAGGIWGVRVPQFIIESFNDGKTDLLGPKSHSMSSDLQHLINQYHVEPDDQRLLQTTPSNTSNEDDQASDQSESDQNLRRLLHSERVKHQRQLAFLQQIIRQNKVAAKTRIRELETRIATLESYRSSENNALHELKEHLHNLAITEQAYFDAVSVPEHLRSLRHMVVINVYKQFEQSDSKISRLLMEIANYKSEGIEQKDIIKQISEENSKLKKAIDVQHEEFITEIENLQSRNKNLSEEYAYVSSVLDDVQLKAKHIGELESKSMLLGNECERVKEELSLILSKYEIVVKERDKAVADLLEKDQENELLRLDKAYFEKENDNLRERIAGNESESNSLKDRVNQLKQQRDESYERIEKLRIDWKTQYEDKLNAELARLQESNGKELIQIRVQQKEAYEREILGLKEYRDILISEKERAMHKYEELRSLYEKLRNESGTCQTMLERQIQESRAQIKVKSFEFERLSIAYEQSSAQYRKVSQSLERAVEENDIYKKQYYQLRADSSRVEAELTTINENLKEKLHTYEQLEKDLDAVITCTDPAYPHNKDESNVLSSVPSMPSRRVKHSVALAQRLLQKQKELQELKEELDNRTRLLKEKEREISEYRNDIKNIEQPYTFFIESIKEHEQQIRRSQTIIEQLYQQVSDLQKENDCLTESKIKLETDVRGFLKRKVDPLPESKQDLNTKIETISKKQQSKTLPSWCQKLVQHNRNHQRINRA